MREKCYRFIYCVYFLNFYRNIIKRYYFFIKLLKMFFWWICIVMRVSYLVFLILVSLVVVMVMSLFRMFRNFWLVFCIIFLFILVLFRVFSEFRVYNIWRFNKSIWDGNMFSNLMSLKLGFSMLMVADLVILWRDFLEIRSRFFS